MKDTISVTQERKIFFLPGKSGVGKINKGPGMIISDRPDDNGIMLELDPGSYPFQIEYKAKSASDTLSLFWIPVGKDYYEVMR